MSELSINPNEGSDSLDGDIDPAKLEQTMRQLRSEQNLLLGTMGGLVAAVVAAVLWPL